MKKLLCIALALVLCFGLTACDNNPATGGTTTTTTTSGFENRTPQSVGTAYADKAVGFQLEAPAVGEKIAIMHTNYGDVYIRFFPEAAPKAVKNFKTHAKNGYYDGLTFHRVIADFMIQGGDPEGTGTGGDSIWGTDFEDEFDTKLLNLRGSLAMANSGVNTNGSQFFINQTKPQEGFRDSMYMSEGEIQELIKELTAEYEAMVEDYGAQVVENVIGTLDYAISASLPTYISDAIPAEVWDIYTQIGGNLHLDGAWRATGGHTVFGQVFQGMDVVDQIAAVNVDTNSKPKEDVIINSIEIVTYQG